MKGFGTLSKAQGLGVLRDSGWNPTWLLRDEFTTDRAAGAVNGTAAEPGPGTREIVDTTNKLSISGNKVIIANGGGVAAGNPAYYTTGITRVSGRAFFTKIKILVDSVFHVGFDADRGVPGFDADFCYFRIGGIRCGSLVSDLEAYAINTDYKVAIIQRSLGCFLFIRGGVFQNWTLLFPDTYGSGLTNYAGFGGNSTTAGGYELDYLRVCNLPAPFNSDYGIATQRLAGARAAGDTLNHEANCLIEFSVTTLPSATQISFDFRRQDANNLWRVAITSTGNINLEEKVDGGFTTRGSTSAGVVANGDRIVIIADGETIKGYSNNVLRWTYATALNFKTATAGVIHGLGTGGAVSDIISWPRTLTGTARNYLERASA